MHANLGQRSFIQSSSQLEQLEARQLLAAGVTGLALIHADTGHVIEALDYGDTIDLARTGARLSVRASAVGAESVRFNYDGEPAYGVDSSAPYSIGGGRGRGRRDQARTPTVGTHTLVVTPYAEDGGEGVPGESRVVLFNVIDSRGNRGRSYAPPTRGGMKVGRPGGRPSAAPTVPGPLYVNVGGGTFTDSLGRVFRSDTGFTGGFTGSSTADVANTLDDALYQSYRAGSRFAFSQPVANGNYSLWLHFAEPTATQAGERTFDVTAEGAVVLDDYDVFAEASGANVATAEAIDVSVTDNRLDLSFAGVAGDAIMSGITLIPTDVPAEAKPYSLLCASDAVKQIRSQTNLRMIGQGVLLYANANKGKLPPDLASIVDMIGMTMAANPRSETSLPRGELTLIEQQAWVASKWPQRTEDYIYLGAGKRVTEFGQDDPLAYENPRRVHGDINVLFGDGHVERLTREEAAALLGFEDVPPSDAPTPTDPSDPSCVRDPATVESAINLRELANALAAYSNDNRGRYPADPGTLFDAEHMDIATFVNPRGDTEVPVGLSHEEQIAWVNAATDYVYLAGGKQSSMGSDVVLAYENPGEVKDGFNILFNDGRVEFREMRWAIETLRRAGAPGVV